MAEQQFPSVVPSLVVSDVKASLEWFGKLGFETSFEMPGPDGSIAHAEVARGSAVRFMMGPTGWGRTPGSTGMSIYVTLTENIDDYHEKVAAAGVAIPDPLTDQFWGDRTFTVEHPDGYRISFAQHVRDVSEEEMAAAAAEWAAAAATA